MSVNKYCMYLYIHNIHRTHMHIYYVNTTFILDAINRHYLIYFVYIYFVFIYLLTGFLWVLKRSEEDFIHPSTN